MATLRSVDLPQPVGPTTERNSPAATRNVVSRTAVYRVPPSDTKVTVTPSSARAGSATSIALFLRSVLRVRLLHELVRVRLREVDRLRLDVRIERGKGFQRRPRARLAEVAV